MLRTEITYVQGFGCRYRVETISLCIGRFRIPVFKKVARATQ